MAPLRRSLTNLLEETVQAKAIKKGVKRRLFPYFKRKNIYVNIYLKNAKGLQSCFLGKLPWQFETSI